MSHIVNHVRSQDLSFLTGQVRNNANVSAKPVNRRCDCQGARNRDNPDDDAYPCSPSYSPHCVSIHVAEVASGKGSPSEGILVPCLLRFSRMTCCRSFLRRPSPILWIAPPSRERRLQSHSRHLAAPASTESGRGG